MKNLLTFIYRAFYGFFGGRSWIWKVIIAGSRDFNDHKLLKWYSDSIIIFLATVFRVVSIFEPPCSWTYNNWPAICIKTRKMHHETPNAPGSAKMHHAFLEMHQGKWKMHHALLRDAPRISHSIKIWVLSHKRTVILIELPFFSFCDRMLWVDEAESLSAMLDDDW